MSTLEQIEAAILKLSADDLEKLRKWFSDLDYQRWDRDLEQDVAEGKLEALANEAIADFEAGAMENWGLITYRDTALLIDENLSSSRYFFFQI